MLLDDARAGPLLREARATTRRAARTFSLACRLLPRDVRDDVHLLYLVMRTLDDLVDERRAEAKGRIAAVEGWCDTGAVTSPETRILASLASRHPLPRQALREFCAGMRDDIARRDPVDDEDLDRYCDRVAGTVGLLMASILGVRGDRDEALRAAAALGRAMQLTNILRDIDEDAEAGRRYIPATAVLRYGPPVAGRRDRLVREYIARADDLYDEGLTGIPRLRRGRRAIAAAAAMYREILREIERSGLGPRPGRAVVPTRRKVAVGARALARARA